MRVTRLYEGGQPVISMEFFPPRTEKAAESFGDVIDKLAENKPDYMTVTFGAGGSTRDGSYQTVKHIVDKHLPTVAYIAGYGLGPDDIREVLDSYTELGIKTIFAIRGDKPKDDDFVPHPDSFEHASDLIAFIKRHYDFTVGCAGYPEGHLEAESLQNDMAYVKQKIDNGAEYVVSQYFYDNDFFFTYVEGLRKLGVTVPVIPGIMPVYTVKMTRMLAKVCGATLTEALNEGLAAIDTEDSNAVLDFGIDTAVRQCRGLLKEGVPGLHFYTMNRSRSTTQIIHRLKRENLL
ncbi:MAG: methylenetetrahydrofolate reductase [Desulfobacterales bacterium]